MTERNARKEDSKKPRSTLLLENLLPPLPSPNDERDPIESQIYNLLGDVSLPRSLLPAIAEQAREKQRHLAALFIEKFGIFPYTKVEYEKRGIDWPGKSPETDEIQAAEQTRVKFNKLIATDQMTRLRAKARDIYERYIVSMQQHSTTEAYFMRSSYALWAEMKEFAVDFLYYGEGNVQIEVDQIDLNKSIIEIRRALEGLRSFGRKGTIHLINDEIRDRYWAGEEITFHFNEDKIERIDMEEFIGYDEQSPLLQFAKDLGDDPGFRVDNVFTYEKDNGYYFQIGPFLVFRRSHDWGELQYGINLETSSLSDDQVMGLVQRLILSVRNYPRTQENSKAA
jgi:hypothetical protein